MDLSEIAELSKCVSIRHDRVHRNGKTIYAKTSMLHEEVIKDIIEKIGAFVKEIANKLKLPGHRYLPLILFFHQEGESSEAEPATSPGRGPLAVG